MEHIINEILEIDEKAKEKLAQAESERNKVIAQAKAEEARMLDESLKAAEEKLNGIEIAEKADAERKMAALNAERDAEIKRLDGIFEARREEWAEKIFLRIIE